MPNFSRFPTGVTRTQKASLRAIRTLSGNFSGRTGVRREFSRPAAIEVPRSERIEEGFLWLLIGALAWVPFWYGSNDWIAWGINAMIFPGLAAAYEISILVRKKTRAMPIGDLAVPAILFACVVIWAAIQTVSWPRAWPGNAVWGMASAVLHHPVAPSISVDPDLTAAALMRLITAASAFWLSVQLCRDSARAKRLVFAVGIIGALYSCYALIAVKFGGLSWLSYIDTSHDRLSSTFIDPDTFATYAAVSFIVLAGLVLSLFGERMRAAAGNWRLQLAFLIERSGGRGAVLIAAAFVVLTALLLTGSRGGAMAGLFGLFVLALLFRRRDRAGVPLLLLLLVAVLVVATLMASGNVVGVKLQEGGIYDENRLAVYRLTLRSIFNEPLFGYGYGTFVDVFPMYRDRSIGVLGVWSQAHNTYLEILQGLGLIVGTVLIGCVGYLVTWCFKGSGRRDAALPAIAVAVTAVVAAHAMVDFSLQIEAVTVTFISILGAGVAQSKASRHAHKH